MCCCSVFWNRASMLGVVEFTAALAVALTAAIFFLWRGRRERRLRAQIPGPPGWPVIGNLLLFLTPIEDLVLQGLAWSKKYGPLLRISVIGLGDLFAVTGPEEVEVLLNSRDNISKDPFYDFIHPWLGTGLLTSTGDKWRSRRRMLNPAFHYKILEDFVHVFNANSAILVARLSERTEDEFVEINDYVSLCALDIICETAMGTSVHAQMGGEVEYVKAVSRICELFTKRSLSPLLYPDCIYRLSRSGREHKKTVRLLQDFSGNVIKKKRLEYQGKKSESQQPGEDSNERLTFLDMLLKTSDQDRKLTDEDIREEVNTFMFAGHDTTAAAISWTLLLLGAHQDIQEKVVSEFSEIFGSDRRQPTIADLQNLTYLDKVIKETLRLYPSVPTITRIIEKELKIGNFTIPVGNKVGVSLFTVHRNATIYPDPERFDPERFSPEQTSGRHPCAFIPFSAGPRSCIGQKFAKLELKSVIFSILRNFRIESLEKPEDVKLKFEVVLKSKDSIKVKFVPRNV